MRDRSPTLRLAIAVLVLAAVTGAGEMVRAQQDKEKIEAGIEVYNTYCFTCHGENLVSSGQTFDLRRLKSTDRKRFETAVEKGKGQMPPWKGVLDEVQIDAVWAYIRANSPEP